MSSRVEPVLRLAERSDVAAICRFGEVHVRAHYEPLIGEEAAAAQVRAWWGAGYVERAVAQGVVVVAEADGVVVGVGQRGRSGDEHVIYKLYVAPEHRGSGLGVQLLEALVAQLPSDAERVHVEHVAANERAGAFYEREGFATERVEPSSTGDPALAQVWRARWLLPTTEQT